MNILKFRKELVFLGFYISRLYNDSKLLYVKIREEVEELCEFEIKEEIIWEVVDVLYFILVKCVKVGE